MANISELNDAINPIFPFYSGNIKLTKVIGHVKLHDFVKAINDPKPKIKEAIKEIKKTNDPKIKRILKHKLYSFTPSVFIEYNKKRNYDNISYYTGLMQVDLDNINDIDLAIDMKEWLFEQPECVCSFLSPSGNVKGLIRTVIPRNKDQYKRLWNSVSEKYSETGYFDEATKNPVLPLFLSVDENVLYRDYNDAKPWVSEKEIKIKYKSLNSTPTSIIDSNNDEYYRKTLRILKNKFDSIVDNGHPQVRSAALILGSRVAAGYISEMDALSNIKQLIISNQYLSKGIKGYIETAEWGVKEGMKNPKYY